MKTLMTQRHPRSVQQLVDLCMTHILGQRAQRHAVQRGHKMAIFANDLIGIDINQFGVYERLDLEMLFHFLRSLDKTFSEGIALDVGANIGNHTLFFAPRFAQVHAFEPSPDTGALLRFNTQWAHNVTVHGVGLGDAAGRLELTEQMTNLGGSSLQAGAATNAARVSIEIRRLDDMVLDMERLCFMKIDVEGFEARVIEGARETIARHRPLIVLEQHLSEFRDGRPAAVQLLQGLDYHFAWHTLSRPTTWPGRRWRDLKEMWTGREHRIVTGDEVEARTHSMLIAVPPRFQDALGLSRPQ